MRRAVATRLCLTGFFLLASLAGAGEQKELSLPVLIKSAVASNPGLKAARLRWQAAIEKYPQAKSLPDPMIEYVYFEESVETRVGPQEHKFGIAQPFPFPGTLKAAGKVTLEDIKIAQVNHERVLRDLIVDLKLSYHELAYLQRAITITEQNQKLMQHAVKLANTHYAKGRATLNDVLKAQAQLAQLGYDLILLKELREVEAAQVNALRDQPTETQIPNLRATAFPKLSIRYEALEKLALRDRQELRIAAHRVQRAEEQVELARFRRMPKFRFSAGTILTGDASTSVADSGKDPITLGISMTLPWNVAKNVAATKEARLKHEAIVQDQRAMENATRALLKKLYFRLENSSRLISLYEKSLIPQAKKSMEIAEAWEVDGQKNLSGFLEAQSVWLNFSLARLRAVTDYRQAYAKLERLAGGSIPGKQEGTNAKD